MLYLVTFTTNIYTPNVSIYTIHGSYGYGTNVTGMVLYLLDLSGNDSHLMADQPHPRLAKDSRSIWGTRALDFELLHAIY
jgi:hypothetical protein